MSASLLIPPYPTFLDTNGLPLAGGLIYTYAAGTTTPQAAYADSTGATALPNPVVLDASGRASIWLGAQNYKIVCQSAAGVVQWTADNVSSVSLAELQASSTFSSLNVTGNAAIGGNETVGGALAAASASITGTANIQGALTAASESVTGNATVGGTFGVTGAATLAAVTAGATTVSALTVGTTPIAALIASMLPTIASVSTRTDTGFFIATIPIASGHLEIGFGSGVIANGGYIPLPAGFSYAQMAAMIAPREIYSNHASDDSSLAHEVNSIGGDGSVSVWQCGVDGQRWPVNGSYTTQTVNWLAILWRQF